MHLASALLSLLRPLTYLLIATYCLLGFGLAAYYSDFVFADGWLRFVEFIAFVVAVGFWYVAGTSLNDYADYEIDKINLPDDKERPAVQGLLAPKRLLTIATMSSAIGLAIVLLINNFILLILYALLLLLNIAYSLKPIQLSRRGIISQALLPIGYIIVPVMGAYSILSTNFNTSFVVFCVGLYIHFSSRLLLKDHRDIKGDKKANKITPVIKYGHHKVMILCGLMYFIGTSLMLVGLYNIIDFAIEIVLFAFGGALYSLYYLYRLSDWARQRVVITIFGRLSTTIVVLMLSIVYGLVLGLDEFNLMMLSVLILLIMGFSIFKIIELNRPAANKY